MPTHPDDLALVARIISGDEEAADDFGRQFLARFEYLVRRAGVPAQDRGDVVQEIFLAALSQMQRGLFRGESGLGTWLEKIVWGKITDYRRARSTQGLRAPSSSLDETGESVAIVEILPAPAIDHNVTIIVRQALSAMPAQARVILLLNRSTGYTLAEISRALGMTGGQVSSRLYKAEEMFRQLIRGDAASRRMIAAAHDSVGELSMSSDDSLKR